MNNNQCLALMTVLLRPIMDTETAKREAVKIGAAFGVTPSPVVEREPK